MDWLIHNIDVCCWAKNAWPKSAQGMGGRQVRTDPKFGHIFDHHAVQFRYPNGAWCFSECRQIDDCVADVSEQVRESETAHREASFVREVLGTPASEKPLLSIDAIQKAVAAYYSIRIADLKGKRRHRGVSRPRMVAMYLCRQLTNASFPEIGLRFGGKDHSTVINACKRIESLKDEEPDLGAAVESLRSQLTS